MIEWNSDHIHSRLFELRLARICKSSMYAKWSIFCELMYKDMHSCGTDCIQCTVVHTYIEASKCNQAAGTHLDIDVAYKVVAQVIADVHLFNCAKLAQLFKHFLIKVLELQSHKRFYIRTSMRYTSQDQLACVCEKRF